METTHQWSLPNVQVSRVYVQENNFQGSVLKVEHYHPFCFLTECVSHHPCSLQGYSKLYLVSKCQKNKALNFQKSQNNCQIHPLNNSLSSIVYNLNNIYFQNHGNVPVTWGTGTALIISAPWCERMSNISLWILCIFCIVFTF